MGKRSKNEARENDKKRGRVTEYRTGGEQAKKQNEAETKRRGITKRTTGEQREISKKAKEGKRLFVIGNAVKIEA